MTGFTRRHPRTLRGAFVILLLCIPALLVGCKNKGSDGPKGPATGAAITGTAQNGDFRLSVNINPNTVALGGSVGITVLATTINGAPLEGRPVQMATSGGTLASVAGKTDAAGKFVTSISVPETYTGDSEIKVTAIVDGLSVSSSLFINVPLGLSIVPSADLLLAPGDRQVLNCVGGVDPVAWEASGGTVNPRTERSTTFTAGTLTGTFFVKCVDAAGNSASVKITITNAPGDKLTVTPPSVTLSPGAKQNFQASGGRTPYTWSFPATAGSPSSGTGSSFTLTAGTTSGTFTLILTDSAGATASATVAIVVPPLTISPSAVTIERQATGGSQAGGDPGTCGTVAFTTNFVGSGGVPPYTWNNAFTSAATITPTSATTAKYDFSLAMSGGGFIDDVVTLTDSKGTLVSAKVSVKCLKTTATINPRVR